VSVPAGAAAAATAVATVAAPVPRLLPHSPQNRAPGAFDDPHAGHETARRFPHSPQNFRPGSFAVPHAEQTKSGALILPASRKSSGRNGITEPDV